MLFKKNKKILDFYEQIQFSEELLRHLQEKRKIRLGELFVIFVQPAISRFFGHI